MMTGYRRSLLPLHPLGIRFVNGGEALLLRLRDVERIDKAKPFKRVVRLRDLVVGVLDIERGDVVRKQHNLISEKLAAIECRLGSVSRPVATG